MIDRIEACLNTAEMWAKPFEDYLKRLDEYQQGLNNNQFNVHKDIASHTFEDLEKSYQIRIPMPGARSEDIDVTCRGNDTIEIRYKSDHASKKANKFCANFNRRFTVPSMDQGEDAVDVALENGVLCVSVKKTPKTEARAIPIKVR